LILRTKSTKTTPYKIPAAQLKKNKRLVGQKTENPAAKMIMRDMLQNSTRKILWLFKETPRPPTPKDGRKKFFLALMLMVAVILTNRK